MNFKELLFQAKNNESQAIKDLLEMYRPLLIKEAIINGIFDEDLYQEFQITFLLCIKRIKV